MPSPESLIAKEAQLLQEIDRWKSEALRLAAENAELRRRIAEALRLAEEANAGKAGAALLGILGGGAAGYLLGKQG